MNAQRQSPKTTQPEVSIRPLQEQDLDAADHIMRVAFGTYLGLPEPAAFMGDAAYIRPRWHADPSAAFGAEAGGELIGSNMASRWGSVGFFGPLTIRPDFWDRGVAQRLMEPIIACFDRWGITHAGLFTFAQSQKHIGLYHKFGFWPRFLTALMSKPVAAAQTGRSSQWTRFSALPENQREATLAACRQLTGTLYEGLDVGPEMRAVAQQGLGDTLLLWNEAGLCGLAVCHQGPGTEAGSGACYVKFGAVRSGPTAASDFLRLLAACEEMAAENGLSRLTAGVNTARHEAYGHMLERGFRTDLQGVVMQRPNEAGYNRPGVYLIDDWR
ncbi:MAG TPA: GNAT family N-acetyltransferase [Prosthecobacter sp.]|nr:GNAT family N-acetyltransferase [Prosthecobacter sp.]